MLKLLIKKLCLEKKRFITRDELREYCRELSIDYYDTIRYLLSRGYLIRILRGIFYVKSIEERKLKKINISYIEGIVRALEMKGIKNWYFGLDTAIKLNNLTHEYFTTDFIINDKIFRPKPIEILGHKIKFIKISSKLTKFGIIKKMVPFSDKEKTVLDIIYLSKYNNLNDFEIKNKITDLIKSCSKNKLLSYSKNYKKTVREFIKLLQKS